MKQRVSKWVPILHWRPHSKTNGLSTVCGQAGSYGRRHQYRAVDCVADENRFRGDSAIYPKNLKAAYARRGGRIVLRHAERTVRACGGSRRGLCEICFIGKENSVNQLHRQHLIRIIRKLVTSITKHTVAWHIDVFVEFLAEK